MHRWASLPTPLCEYYVLSLELLRVHFVFLFVSHRCFVASLGEERLLHNFWGVGGLDQLASKQHQHPIPCQKRLEFPSSFLYKSYPGLVLLSIRVQMETGVDTIS